MNDENIVLECRNLNVHFKMDEGLLTAVNGIDFTIYEGKTLGIVGESGCGKTVANQAILRLLPKYANITGELVFHPKNGSAPVDIVKLSNNSSAIQAIRGGEIAMIFQEPMKAFSPIHTIGDQIIEAIQLHVEPNFQKAHDIAVDMLNRVGISDANQRINEYPHQLSGGMRQRAMIAMAIACNPRLLIADEPTTALDVTVQAQVLELINKLKSDLGSAVVFVTHNMSVIAEISDYVAVMYLGKIVEYSDVVSFFKNPIHPYSIALMRSIPDLAAIAGSKLDSIEGTVPYPMNLPEGCGFYSRCKLAQKDICNIDNIKMVEVEPGHFVRCLRVLPEGESSFD